MNAQEIAKGIVLEDVAEAMDRSFEDPSEPLLDTKTGTIVFAPNPDLTGEEEPDLERALEEEPLRFVPIPHVSGQDEYQWMAAFTETIDEEDVQQRLLDALSGKGAFGRFRAVLRDYPDLRARWYAERLEHLVEQATHWLRGAGIAFVPKRRDVAPPTSPEMAAPAPAAKKDPPLPLRLAHVLLLGTRDGDAEGTTGRVRRVLQAGDRNPRMLFKLLARDLCFMSGVEWRKRFIEGTKSFEHDGIRVWHDDHAVYVELEVPPAVLGLFTP